MLRIRSSNHEQPDPEQPSTEPPNQTEDKVQNFKKFPSPILCLPKPLGLAYRNFNVHYHDLVFYDGTRNEAGARLMADLLSHYFPRPEYNHQRLYPSDVVIESLPTENLSYFVVRKADQIKAAHTASRVGRPKKQAKGKDPVSQDRRQKSNSDSFTLIAVSVTAKSFLERSERKSPKVLEFGSCVVERGGGLVWDQGLGEVDDVRLDQGYVVMLAGTPKPPSPTFEFYSFGGKEEVDREVTPWYGQTEQNPEGCDKHSFPLTVENGETVDTLFKTIVQCADITTATVPELATPVKKKKGKPIGRLSDNYLNSLRVNSKGRIVGYQSQWLKQDMEEEARKQAEERGITFPKIQPRRPTSE